VWDGEEEIGEGTVEAHGEGFEVGQRNVHERLLEFADVSFVEAGGGCPLLLIPRAGSAQPDEILSEALTQGGARLAIATAGIRVRPAPGGLGSRTHSQVPSRPRGISGEAGQSPARSVGDSSDRPQSHLAWASND
jgi:hypothetical protein